MMRYAWIPIVLLFASCDTLREWAASQPSPVNPPPPDAGGHLPQVGGGDILDVVVTVLTMLGLLPAARLVGAGRPWIAALVRAVLPKKSTDTTEPPQSTPPAP